MVVELGATFLAAHLDLTPEVQPDHGAYTLTKLKVRKDDKWSVFSAAVAHAQCAADHLHEL